MSDYMLSVLAAMPGVLGAIAFGYFMGWRDGRDAQQKPKAPPIKVARYSRDERERGVL